ncbi:VCBS repeat-containing protein [Reichenbachiella agariperforans]|nr:VCBS repeat-containing protein [Reichenbachiella agariperforans]
MMRKLELYLAMRNITKNRNLPNRRSVFTLTLLIFTLLLSEFSASAQWSTDTLSDARRILSASSVGDKVLFAGGFDGTNYSSVVDIYDSNTELWSTAALSQARGEMVAVNVGDKVLFAGGGTSSSSSVVDIYDNNTGTWSTGTLSEARTWLSGTSVGDKAFFAGGFNSAVSSVVDIYDNSTDTWSTATLSEARRYLSATSVGNKVFFAGGINASEASSVVDIYDNSTDTWSTEVLSVARSLMSATSVGDKVFFAGGLDDVGSSSVVDIYDNSTDTWSTATLSQARYFLVATSVGDKVFFAGGFNSAVSSVVDIYDNSTDTWSTTTLSEARRYLSATSVGDKVFFAGGDTGSESSNVVDIYTLEEETETATYTGAFSLETLSGLTTPQDVVFVDINNDGLKDLIVTDQIGSGASVLRVYENTSSGGVFSYNELASISVNDTPVVLATGDLNQDGLVDIICGNSDNTFTLHRNTGSGSFAASQSVSYGTEVSDIEIGDIDTDGVVDIVVSSYDGEKFSVYLNNTAAEATSFGFDAAVEETGIIGAKGLALGDIDQNGVLDVVVASQDANLFRVYQNSSTDGTVSFGSTGSIAQYSVTTPHDVVLQDLNEDNYPELIATTGTGNVVTLYENVGSGSGSFIFSNRQNLLTGGTTPYALQVVDVDGDYLADLVMSNSGSDEVSIFLNEYEGSGIALGSPELYSVGTGGMGITVADLTGDGLPEIAVANEQSNTVSVLLNAGEESSESNDLIAQYLFEGDATDSSGNANDGVLGDGVTSTTFPTLTTDRDGNADAAYSFDGGDYIAVPHDEGFDWGTDVDVTAMCWFNTTSTELSALLFKEDGFNGLIVYLSDGSISLYGGEFLESNTTDLNDGTWHHVAVTLDRDQGMSIYIDGVLDASNTVATSLYDFTDTRDFLIGSAQTTGSVKNSFFVGAIDQVHVYNQSLTLSEIQNVFVMEGDETAASDRDALMALYNATDGANWTNVWDLNAEMSTWYGVGLDENGRVDSLNLAENNLTGSLPAEVGELTALRHLIIHNNQIGGVLPSELGDLEGLEILSLSINDFEGEIPAEIGALSNLYELYLNQNDLVGSIPVSLGSLSGLNKLYLYGNDLTGDMPIELGSLTSLEILDLSSNKLSGSVPAEFGNLTLLKDLRLQFNELSGELPVEIGSLTSLSTLAFHGNNITGIPDLTALSLDAFGLYVYGNSIGFGDIYANISLHEEGVNFFYSPQTIEEEEFLEVSDGQTLNLTTSESFTGTVYQWFVNGDSIPNATTNTYSFVYADGDEGVYTVKMTNEFVPELIISRANYLVSDGVNEAPSKISLSDTTVFETDAVGTIVANLSATDDPGDSHSFALIAGDGDTDNDHFSINEANQLVLEEVVDFATNEVLYIRLQATDQFDVTYSENFELQIIPDIVCQSDVLTESEGVFDDGSAEFNYENNFNCSWLIEGGVGEQVTLGFNAFDVELDYDFVRIYDGSDTSAPLLAELTGQITLPNEINSTSTSLLVVFETDGGVVATGWEAYYSIGSEVLSSINGYGEADGRGGFNASSFSDQVSTEMTIEFLLNVDQFPEAGVYSQIFQIENTNIQYIESLEGGDRNVEFYTGDGISSGASDSWLGLNPTEMGGFESNKWYHFAFVYANGTKSIYLNGSFVKDEAFEWLNAGNVSDLGVIPNFDAKIDEVRFWNIARTDIEIRDNMQTELVGNETGLVGYWPFNSYTDQGDDSSITPDLTTNQKDLSFSNANAQIIGNLQSPVLSEATEVSSTGFTINWETVESATAYDLLIDDNDDFSSPEFTENFDGSTITFTATGLNQETVYYIKLTASIDDVTSEPAYGTVSTLGLVSVYFPFNGNTNDESGNGFNGVLGDGTAGTMPVLTSDKFGNANQAYWFDASSDYIKTDFTPEAGDLSISVWVYWEENLNDYREILGFTSEDNSVINYLGVNAEGNIRFKEDIDVAMPVQQWTHIVVTYDGTNTSLYMNGELKATQFAEGYTFGPLTIGAFDRNGGESWNGAIDELKIYSQVIEGSTIMSLYHEGWEGLSDEVDFLSFELSDQIGVAKIEEDSHEITHKIAGSADITSQTLTYILSSGASLYANDVELVSGSSTIDFTNPVSFEVIASNGFSKSQWTANVTKEVGLAAYYSFTAGSLTDGTGFGNDLILGNGVEVGYNPVTIADRYDNAGNAYMFDGVDDFMSINSGAGVSISGDLTFNVWIYVTQIDNSGPFILYTLGDVEYMDFRLTSEGLLAYSASNSENVYSEDPVRMETWTMATVARVGTTVNLYIDGELSTTGVTTQTGGFSVTSIGGSTDAVAFGGAMDDMRLYDRGLSDDEVRRIYESEKVNVQISLSANAIDENLESGHEIGSFSDENGTYSILSSGTEFTIDGFKLLANRSFNYEEQSVYPITVGYDKGNGAVIEQDFEITINNVEEVPVFSNPTFNSTIDLNIVESTDVSIEVFDPEGETLTVTVKYVNATENPESPNTQAAIVYLDGVFGYTFDATDFDQTSLSYVFVASDGISESTSDTFNIAPVLPSGAFSVSVNTGSTESDYRIVSLPFQSVSVTELFSDLVGKDKDEWRLLHYNGSSYTEYPSLKTLEAGKGYWFLNTVSFDFEVPSATVVRATENRPFEISVRQGQNQIGNPYLTNINWNEVISHNGLSGTLYTYQNGTWSSASSTLRAFEGAFYSNSDASLTEIEIPLSAVRNASARTTDAPKLMTSQGVFGSDDWSFGFNINSGNKGYYVSAVGMKPEAAIGLDRFDALPLPRFSEYLDVVFTQHGVTKDIVSPSDSYSWSFDVNSASEKQVTINWDNSTMQNSDFGMYLIDVSNQMIIDVSNKSSYTFKPIAVSTSFELIYGRKVDLKEQISTITDLMIDPYPNPFADQLVLPIATTAESSTVSVMMLDLSGRAVYQISEVGVTSGYHEYMLEAGQLTDGVLRSGTYLIQVKIQSANHQSTFNKRVVYIR